MKYVCDASVAFKWVVPEIDSDQALRLRDDFTNSLVDLITPDIFSTELAHALTRAERQGRLAPTQAAQAWKAVMDDPPSLTESLPLTPRAIDISSTYRIGVYDCIYIALAELEGCEFITADEKAVKKLQIQFPFIIALSSMP